MTSDGIIVKPRDDGAFDVDVSYPTGMTHHVVTVPPGLAAELGQQPEDDRHLVWLSFDFLLEREPATSILPSFSLDVISRYFPEYQTEMRERLR